MPKSMTKRRTTTISDETVDNTVEEEIIEEKPVTKEKRVFANDELIPCRSITNGELLMVGNKTHNLYRWADYDDVAEVEYQDLIYETRIARNSFVTFPRFIVLDDDFIEQNKQIQEIYDSLYSVKDLRDILKMSASDIKSIVPTLPKGAFESLKGLASTMILNGQLDSVQKIKALDELFDTEMMNILAEH